MHSIEQIKIELLKNEPVLGFLIYKILTKYSEKIDTLAVYFDTNLFSYVMLINPNFFEKLNYDEKIAVIKHELYHIYFRHHYRFSEIPYLDPEIANIAADISINQYIENLPETALFPEDFGLPKDLNFEKYYELLYSKFKRLNKKNGNDNNRNLEKNIASNSNNQSKNNETSNTKKENMNNINNKESKDNNEKNNKNSINKEKLRLPKNKKLVDNHKGLLKKRKDKEFIDKYTQELIKESFKYAEENAKTFKKDLKIPSGLKDIYRSIKINNDKKRININKIIKNWIDKEILSNKFKYSWKYINRRFETYKGKKKELKKHIYIAIDTSASISEEIINKFLNTLYNSLDLIYDEVTVLLFHTEVYYEIKFKKKKNINKIINNIEIGGTDIQKVFDYVNSQNKYTYKYLIILTDARTNYPLKTYMINTLWINENINKFKIIKKKEIKNINEIFI